MADSAEVNSAVQPGKIETVQPEEIDSVGEIEQLRKDIELLKVDIQEVKKQNGLILAELSKLAESKKSEEHLTTLKSYWGLPIPKLTLDCDVQGWFERYASVMGTKDQEILKNCLGYYLDDEVTAVFSKVSGSFFNIQGDLDTEIGEAKRQKSYEQKCEKEKRKQEYLEHYEEVLKVAKRESASRY